MKKTIGFFDDSAGPGGTTRYLSMLISGLSRSEFDLVLFAVRPSEWHREFESMGVEIVTLLPREEAGAGAAVSVSPSGERRARRVVLPAAVGWWLGLLKETIRLRGLFAKRRVDLLHSNNAGAEPAPIAARLAGVPKVIATWHVDSTYDLEHVRSGPRYRLLETICMRSLHHAIAVSRATADDWTKRCRLSASYRKRITVIHNGIQADRLRRRSSITEAKEAAGLADRLVIGSMGRLEAAKGYEYLIRALPAIVGKHPETLVRIAGRGDLRDGLLRLAKELGVERHLEFRGFVGDVLGFLEAIDIYVQPSLCEALGIAILEASAVGIPVVASDVGGIPEIVRDGGSGFAVAPRNADALAGAICVIAGDRALRAKMAAEGQRTVAEQFRQEAMVAETVKIYRELLGDRS